MDGMSPRKQLASGGSVMVGMPSTRGNKDNTFSMNSGPNFGVSPVLGGVEAEPHIDRDMGTAPDMPDHMRAAKPGIPGGRKRLRNQANPDHGPHHATNAKMRSGY